MHEFAVYIKLKKMARKKIAGAADYIIPLGLLGIVALVLYKSGIFSGNLTGTGSNNAASAATSASTAQAAFANSAQTVPQSLPDTTLNSMINTMLADANANTNLFSGSTYQQDIVNQMSNLDNITDLYRLMSLWGTRAVSTSFASACALFNVACSQVDLGTFLKITLTSDQLAQVNQDLGGNGINYSFT